MSETQRRERVRTGLSNLLKRRRWSRVVGLGQVFHPKGQRWEHVDRDGIAQAVREERRTAEQQAVN